MGTCYSPPVLVRRQSCWIKQNKIFHTHISATIRVICGCRSPSPVVFCILPRAHSSRAAAVVFTTEWPALMHRFHCSETLCAAEALPSDCYHSLSSSHRNHKKSFKTETMALETLISHRVFYDFNHF